MSDELNAVLRYLESYAFAQYRAKAISGCALGRILNDIDIVEGKNDKKKTD